MKNIAVIFGGNSVAHDISILTGLHAARHIENYRVHYVYLTRENQMVTAGNVGNIDSHINKKVKGKPCHFANGNLVIKNRTIKIEAVLNCCHGGVGENGELAAYFAVANVPVTSCDHIPAATMQSKIKTREILREHDFIQPKFIALSCDEVNANAVQINEILHTLVVNQIEFPVIVKPDTLGSSIGISVAENETELGNALEVAFKLDKVVIVEEFLQNIREINCSAMRLGYQIETSECEEICTKKTFLDFDTKYLDAESGFIKKGKDEKGKKIKSVKSKGNENDQKIFDEIKEMTKRAYEIFGSSGIVRADFIVVNDKIYLNEINTIPGFLSYHLWARIGIPYGLLINNLVKQTLFDFGNKAPQTTSFDSDILIKNRSLVTN